MGNHVGTVKLRKLVLILPLIGALWCDAAFARQVAGSYLAARQAGYLGDFEASALYNARVISRDRNNLRAMEDLVIAYVAMGRMASAINVAEVFQKNGAGSYFVHSVVLAEAVKKQDFRKVLELLDSEEAGRSFLLSALIKGWALAGEGRTEAAVAQFEKIAEDKNLSGFANYHKALLYLSKGDADFAETTLKTYFDGGGAATNRNLIALIRALMQQGKFDDAKEYFEASFGDRPSPALSELYQKILGRQKPNSLLVGDPRHGVAEVFLTVAQILSADDSDENTLMFARIAEFLREESTEATLLCGQILVDLEQFDIAAETFKKIPQDAPESLIAEIGRAEALSKDGRRDEAIDVLRDLTSKQPNAVVAFQELGDELRYSEQFEGAVGAYNTALEILDAQQRQNWVLYYSRGMTFERLDQWDKAEADFRMALKLQPNQPYVLNYLGYSLVEKKLKLDEALEMIELAVSLRSDSGYIVDSLGWVLYKLNRHDEAVGHLEKATELMPVDPIINDHLGDAYWAVGRKREARFQWRRALSFDPEEKDETRIRLKLEIGLDEVLIQESSAPTLSSAQND